MVYVGVDRPSLQNSSVVPGPAASRPARAGWHFAPLAGGVTEPWAPIRVICGGTPLAIQLDGPAVS